MALLMKREFVELEVVDLVGKVIIRVSTTSESFLVCIGLGSYLSKIRKQIQKWVGTYLHILILVFYLRTLSIAAIDGFGFLVTNTCLIIGHTSEMTSTTGVQNALILKITLVYSSKLFKK